MSAGMDDLGKVLRLRTGPGAEHAVGVMIGYCDVPTVTIRKPSGQQVSWRADLADPLEGDELAAYWKQRAEGAEEKLERIDCMHFSEQAPCGNCGSRRWTHLYSEGCDWCMPDGPTIEDMDSGGAL